MSMTPPLSPVTACLAKCSPDVASVSWLVVNLLCLFWSLYVALHGIWASIHKEEPDTEFDTSNNAIGDDDDNIVPDMSRVSESGSVTVEYLVWSLVMTTVWIVEVTLRTAFPPAVTIMSPSQNGDGILRNPPTDSEIVENECRVPHSQLVQDQQSQKNGERDIFNLCSVNFDSISHHHQQEPCQQQQRRRGVLVLELLLAIFFFVGSAIDCWNWKAHVAEDDVFGEEVDIWISILGYLYMTYETYKAVSRKRKLDATNIHFQSTTSPLMQRGIATSYVNMTEILDNSHESTRESNGSLAHN